MLSGAGKAAISADIAVLVRDGRSRDQAVTIAFDRARPQYRSDAFDSGYAQAVVHQVAIAHVHGIGKKRRRMPRQNYPRALESEYASRIVALVHRARSRYDKLLTALPALLARAQAERGDSVRMDAIATFAQLASDVLPHRRFAGLDIVIENPSGSTRSWMDSDGTVGHTLMKYDYGFIDGAEGADGDEVDVYLGPEENAPWVYVIHQQSKASGFIEYDEDKVMLGFSSSDAAQAAYLSQYDDPRFLGGVTQMSAEDFRAALAVVDGEKITHRADAGPFGNDMARRLIDEAEAQMRRDLNTTEIEQLASYFARKTSQAQRRELARQLAAALGTDVLPDEQHIPALLEYFTHENATLIGSIPEQLHQEVANLTARAFTKRMNPDTFATLLQDRFDVAEWRARFIARDQLGKLWGQVNAVRQRSIGIDRFIWSTREDGLVRQSHRSVGNKVWSYDNPPMIRDGERMLPGEDYGCRCDADPVVDDILDAANEIRGRMRPGR